MPEKDKYANVHQVTLTESAATTLTFEDINLGLTIFQKVAIKINRVVVDWGATLLRALDDDGDRTLVGISQSDQIAAITLEETAVIFKAERMAIVQGTAGNWQLVETVQTFDFSGLPGGGELITPRPLYGAIQSAGLTSAQTATMRIYYTIVELKPDEYFELLEAHRFF